MIKRARDRCKSAEKKLSIKDLYADVKSRNASVVNSSPFKASMSFLLTPAAISLDCGMPNKRELTHAGEALCIETSKLAPSGKCTELRIVQLQELELTRPPDIQIHKQNPVRQWICDNRAIWAVKVISDKFKSQSKQLES